MFAFGYPSGLQGAIFSLDGAPGRTICSFNQLETLRVHTSVPVKQFTFWGGKPARGRVHGEPQAHEAGFEAFVRGIFQGRFDRPGVDHCSVRHQNDHG